MFLFVVWLVGFLNEIRGVYGINNDFWDLIKTATSMSITYYCLVGSFSCCGSAWGKVDQPSRLWRGWWFGAISAVCCADRLGKFQFPACLLILLLSSCHGTMYVGACVCLCKVKGIWILLTLWSPRALLGTFWSHGLFPLSLLWSGSGPLDLCHWVL